jgi:ParB family chromosome partitioning protein
MNKPHPRLGKGLNALIPSHGTKSLPPAGESQPAPDGQHHVLELPVDCISPNPRQPRTTFSADTLAQLAESIRANGVLQPVIVRTSGDHSYQLVAGERRWRAAKLAGLVTVPAVIHGLSDAQALEVALVENLQREDLAPLERAAAYQHYLDFFGGTIEELAQRLAESRANISNYLRLLKLRPEVCYLLGTGELGMGQARALAAITNPEQQLALARLATRRNLSVRQVEDLVRSAADVESETPTVAQAASAPHSQQIRNVEESLTKAIGLHVRIAPGKKRNSGRVIIRYGNLEEFDRIAERLGGRADME